MKKTILFIAAGIIVFCIVPIATTQAMPRKVEGEGNIISNPPNAFLSILNQKELRTIDAGQSIPLLKDNILSYGMQELRGTTIARGGNRPGGNNNPYVKRRGYGRSTMGDNYDNESGGDAED
jgi:hypothetical protein